MEPKTLASLTRAGRRTLALCGLLAVTAAGGGVSPAHAAPLDDCLVPLPVLPCVTLPTAPAIPAPTPTQPPPPGTTPAPTPAPAPAAPTPSPQQPAEAQAAPDAFTYAFTRFAATRKNGVRSIVGTLSLNKAATFVAVVRRQNVPYVVAVETRMPGTSSVTLSVPKRMRAGRYTLDLVLGLGDRRYTVTRAIGIPK